MSTAVNLAAQSRLFANTPLNTITECTICLEEIERPDQVVQCASHHKVCTECLKRYSQEAISGNVLATLPCMAVPSCRSTYSKENRLKALTQQQIEQLDEREQQESIRLAGIDDLVNCPFCDYAAILAQNDQVFACVGCKRSSCRLCRIEWSEHDGTCEQLENKNETAVRKQYEERMTQARVHYCPRCKQPCIKDYGCNKITCRCGTHFCYVCSEEVVDYGHFSDTKCKLNSNEDRTADQNIENLQREAEQVQRENGLRERSVGVSKSQIADQDGLDKDVRGYRPRRPARFRRQRRPQAAQNEPTRQELPAAPKQAAAQEIPLQQRQARPFGTRLLPHVHHQRTDQPQPSSVQHPPQFDFEDLFSEAEQIASNWLGFEPQLTASATRNTWKYRDAYRYANRYENQTDHPLGQVLTGIATNSVWDSALWHNDEPNMTNAYSGGCCGRCHNRKRLVPKPGCTCGSCYQ